MRIQSRDNPDNLVAAESAMFPSPIPTQSVSSDEFIPPPQTPRQKLFEARVKEMGTRMAKKLGMSRRRFFQSASGMAAAFLAMNDTYGPLFGVGRAEAADPAAAGENPLGPVHHGHAYPLPSPRHQDHELCRAALGGRQGGLECRAR